MGLFYLDDDSTATATNISSKQPVEQAGVVDAVQDEKQPVKQAEAGVPNGDDLSCPSLETILEKMLQVPEALAAQQFDNNTVLFAFKNVLYFIEKNEAQMEDRKARIAEELAEINENIRAAEQAKARKKEIEKKIANTTDFAGLMRELRHNELLLAGLPADELRSNALRLEELRLGLDGQYLNECKKKVETKVKKVEEEQPIGKPKQTEKKLQLSGSSDASMGQLADSSTRSTSVLASADSTPRKSRSSRSSQSPMDVVAPAEDAAKMKRYSDMQQHAVTKANDFNTLKQSLLTSIQKYLDMRAAKQSSSDMNSFCRFFHHSAIAVRNLPHNKDVTNSKVECAQELMTKINKIEKSQQSQLYELIAEAQTFNREQQEKALHSWWSSAEGEFGKRLNECLAILGKCNVPSPSHACGFGL